MTLRPVAGAPKPGDVRGRKRQTAKERAACVAAASGQFRAAVGAQLLPRLKAFRPDLILVSAGFDGADKEYGEAWGESGE